MMMKEKSEKAGLKLIQKAKIMESSPITWWQIDGEKMETVTDFIFLGFKITVDSDFNHESKTLAPWKKSYDKPRQHIKCRDITLLTKVLIVKAMFFWGIIYRCDSWTIKKAEPWRTDTFKLWFWRRLLRFPWKQRDHTSQSYGNQHWIFIWRTMMKLKLQYFSHRMQKANSLEKTDSGEDWMQKERGKQRMRCLDCTTDSTDLSMSKLQEMVKDTQPWCPRVHKESDMTGTE